MAEMNRDWIDQSNQYRDDDRDRNRRREDTRNRENYESYGNSGYQDRYRQRTGHGNYGESSGQFGDRGDRDYGNRNQQWQSNQPYSGSNYGNQYGTGRDWNQHNLGSAGMYGGDFGREDADRGYAGYGSQYGQYRSGDRYSSPGYNRGYQGGNYGYENTGNRSNYDRGYENRGWSDRDREYGQEGNRSWWDKTKDEVSSWVGDEDAERRRRMDEQRAGMHRGKGPKGYRRSEERIREDVCERLSEDDRLDASEIQVQVQGEEVILSGSVHDKEQKRRAEDVVESILGVKNVDNRIRVTGRQEMGDYTGTTDRLGGIGSSSGTTSEIIRDVNKEGRRR